MPDNTADTPAIAGGDPAKKTAWGQEKRYGEEELHELKEALDQGSLFYAHGGKVRKLEEELARKAGARYGIASSSGTTGIHAALIALGVSPGDEVILPPITDMGSAIPILFQGAVPVFADVHPNSYTILPEAVEAAITPRTRAVLAVHLWGNACDMNALRSICDRHSLALVEDCAQAMGCLYDGKLVGTVGDIGCFSFNEFKHIACGDGGVAVTNDENLAKRLRLATDKCYNREERAAIREPVFLANNYRMTELQGAVGLSQLRKIDGIARRRRTWCGNLSMRLGSLDGVSLPEPTAGCEPSWWFYMMRVDKERLGADVDTFAKAVSAEGLPIGAHYIGKCIYEYPIFTEHSAFERGYHPYCDYTYGKGLCPTAEAVLDTCARLHVHQVYTDTDLEETAHGITRVVRWFNSRRK